MIAFIPPTTFEAHEERVTAITKIAVDLKALVLLSRRIPGLVDHKIHGTPDEIFDAVQSALEI